MKTEDANTLMTAVIKAGYVDRIDIERLTADVRKKPGCSKVQARSVSNYINGRQRPPTHIALALSQITGLSLAQVAGLEPQSEPGAGEASR